MCRDHGKVRKHRCSAWHRALMEAYYSARNAQEQRAEMYGYGYESETADYYRDVEPKITFKMFLCNWKMYVAYEEAYAA